MSDSTPNEELRELADRFRERQAECDLSRSGLTGEIKRCADDLEELIGDE